MQNLNVPSEITLIYRNVGEGRVHVFTAVGMSGFYIGSSNRKKAFETAFNALNDHASQLYGCHVNYCAETSYDEFEALLHGSDISAPLVVARRSVKAAA